VAVRTSGVGLSGSALFFLTSVAADVSRSHLEEPLTAQVGQGLEFLPGISTFLRREIA